jgi:hypothetical protein
MSVPELPQLPPQLTMRAEFDGVVARLGPGLVSSACGTVAAEVFMYGANLYPCNCIFLLRIPEAEDQLVYIRGCIYRFLGPGGEDYGHHYHQIDQTPLAEDAAHDRYNEQLDRLA